MFLLRAGTANVLKIFILQKLVAQIETKNGKDSCRMFLRITLQHDHEKLLSESLVSDQGTSKNSPNNSIRKQEHPTLNVDLYHVILVAIGVYSSAHVVPFVRLLHIADYQLCVVPVQAVSTNRHLASNF